MEKKIKKNLLRTWNLLNILFESEIDNKCSDFDSISISLQKYQESIINFGNIIERNVQNDEKRRIIPNLEHYCEEIFQLSQNSNNQEVYQSICEKMKEEQQEIQSLLTEFKTKKVALFLPYKYSMWDSLASIYEAVKADLNWDAIVMPIPYVEKSKDQKEIQWYYEGSYFEQIPTVSFKEYDISTEKPDGIFIHNPYDGYNNVTSVASDYYSSELKKYCKYLIYVPYFYTGKKFPNVHLYLPTYEKFDYIVVPSLDSKNEMKKYVREDKILLLGSPKVDAVLNEKEAYPLPEGWEKIKQHKKVVLLSTGLGTILNQGFHSILKIRYIFDYFKSQTDLVLWWRPHPLIKSSLRSMRPELLGSFEALEQSFIQEKIGIFDNTPNDSRAVVQSDAFLGDYSSIMYLYGILGKPIFLTDTVTLATPKMEDRKVVWMGMPARELFYTCKDCWNVKDKKGNFYFYSRDYKLFCRLTREMDVQVIQYIDSPLCRIQAFFLEESNSIQIHFYPMDLEQPVKIYDVDLKKWREEENKASIPWYQYGQEVHYKNQRIFCPGQNPEFLVLSEDGRTYEKYSGYEEQLMMASSYLGEPLFGFFGQRDKFIYALSYRTNQLLEFNMESKEWELYKIGIKEIQYSSFYIDNQYFWFLARDGSCIGRWEKDKDLFKVYNQFPKNFRGLDNAFVSSYTPAFDAFIDIGKEIIVFPWCANEVLFIDKFSDEIKEWDVRFSYIEGQRKSSIYNMDYNYQKVLKISNHEILLQTAYDGSLLLIDTETKEVKRKECVLSDVDYEKYKISVKDQVKQNTPDMPYTVTENSISCTLEDMMEFFKENPDFNKENQRKVSTEGIANVDGSCGRKIHAYISSKFETE